MIDIQGLSKKFRLHHTPLDRVKEWLGLRADVMEFWALRQVSLYVPRSRTVGIIGPNGAGKSTLLKVITGTLLPTSGTVHVEGRIAALLELGTGFHPEFTGRQNIFINGQLLGLTRDEIAAREEEIIRFSELGVFIDQPLRTYSSGMVVRLGFAVAAAINPEILIVDEALSVGDARFSQKCIRRIRQFREDGATILFVSHDPGAIMTLCDEAILINEGAVTARGNPRDVLDEYNALLAAKGDGNAEMRIHKVEEPVSTGWRRSGTFHALIRKVETLDGRGQASDTFAPGDALTIRITVDFLAPLANPTVGVLIRDRLGLELFGTNTALMGGQTGHVAPGDSLTAEFHMRLAIGHGDYTITVAVHDDETHLDACFDWSDHVANLKVRMPGRALWKGAAMLEPTLRIARDASAEFQANLEAVFAPIGSEILPEAPAPNPFLGGFFPLETGSDGRPYRWASSRATFVLRPDAERVAVSIGQDGRIAAGAPLAAATLRIVGGPEIGRWDGAGAETALVGAVPPEYLGRLTLFEVAFDPPFVPSRHGHGGDERELGAMVYGVRCLRAESLTHA